MNIVFDAGLNLRIPGIHSRGQQLQKKAFT